MKSLFLAPPLLALLLLLLGSLFPLRLDYRTLQDAARIASLPSENTQHIYLSGKNGTEAGRIALFALRHHVFPNGSWLWLVPAEHLDGQWWGEWVAVDSSGLFYSPGRPPPSVAPAPVPPGLGSLAEATLLYDSQEVLDLFLSRLPQLEEVGNTYDITKLPAVKSFVVRTPDNEITFVRWMRLTLLVGAVVSWAALFARTGREDRCLRILSGAIGIFFAVAFNLWLAAIAGPDLWTPSLWGQWLLGGWIAARKHHQSFPSSPPDQISFGIVAAVTFVGLASMTVFLLRLDFDGDVLTHWLPMARAYFHFGSHRPEELLAMGSMHAATYPPGFGMFLASTMWVAELQENFQIAQETSLALLDYRLAIWVLNVALVVALSAAFFPGRHFLWLAAIAFCVGFFPTMRGEHIAAETLLFPLLAAALTGIVAGARREMFCLVCAGIAIASASTLVKWEATLLVGATALPWAIVAISRSPAGTKIRRATILAAIAIVAFVPTALWKANLQIDNHFFEPASLAGLWEAKREWFQLFIHSTVVLLKSPLVIPLLLLLPAGFFLRMGSKFHWSDLMVPTATVAIFFALVSIYVFSNWTTKTLHIDQSLDRLLIVPAFSALLYFLDSLVKCESRSPAESMP